MQVLCTSNPSDLAGGSGPLDPYFVSSSSVTPGVSVTTPWVEYPDLYTAQCQSSGAATWLQVNDIATAGDSLAPGSPKRSARSGGSISTM